MLHELLILLFVIIASFVTLATGTSPPAPGTSPTATTGIEHNASVSITPILSNPHRAKQRTYAAKQGNTKSIGVTFLDDVRQKKYNKRGRVTTERIIPINDK